MEEVSMFVIILIAVLITMFFIIQVWFMYIKPWSHIPSVGITVPFLGNVVVYPGREAELKTLTSFFNTVGETFVFWMLSRPYVFTNNLSIIETIMNSNTVLSKGNGYYFLRDWIQDGLICSDGEKWRKRRKQLTHCFHFEVLKNSMKIMESHSQILLKKLRELADSRAKFDILKETKYFSLKVICENAVGVNLDSLDDSGIFRKEYINSIAAVSRIMVERERTPLYWFAPIFTLFQTGRLYYKSVDTINKFVRNAIETKIKEFETQKNQIDKPAQPKNKKILLDSLLELYEKGEINVEGIVEETNNFLFAGHDTVSTALAWCLYMLGRNKESQTKAFQEVIGVEKKNLESIDEKVTALKYIDCVVKETLRLHPVAPLISRYVDEDLNIDGFIIPKGTDVAFNLYALHREEAYWENPLEFVPERFQEGGAASKRPVFSYIPFSAGARNCIGSRFAMMELKIALYNILLHFEIEAMQKESELIEVVDVVHHSANGLLLKVLTRN